MYILLLTDDTQPSNERPATMNMINNDAYASAHAEALTDEQLHRIAPSIFATTAHSSRSERFTPVPTINVINGMRHAGFYPVAAKQSGSRVEDRKDFTKHLPRGGAIIRSLWKVTL